MRLMSRGNPRALCASASTAGGSNRGSSHPASRRRCALCDDLPVTVEATRSESQAGEADDEVRLLAALRILNRSHGTPCSPAPRSAVCGIPAQCVTWFLAPPCSDLRRMASCAALCGLAALVCAVCGRRSRGGAIPEDYTRSCRMTACPRIRAVQGRRKAPAARSPSLSPALGIGGVEQVLVPLGRFLCGTRAGATAIAAVAVTVMAVGASALIVDHVGLVGQRDMLKSAADSAAVAATQEMARRSGETLTDDALEAALEPLARRYVLLNLSHLAPQCYARAKESLTVGASGCSNTRGVGRTRAPGGPQLDGQRGCGSRGDRATP